MRSLFERIRRYDSVGARLAAGFGVVLLVTLAMAAASAMLLDGIVRDNAEAARRAARLNEAARWHGLVQMNLERALTVTRLEAAIAAGAPQAALAPAQARLAQEMADAANASTELQKRLERDLDDAGLLKLIAEVAAARQRFVVLRQKIHDDLQMGEGAARIDAELAPAARAMLDALQVLGDEIGRRTTATYARVDAAARSGLLLLAVGVCAGIALSAAIAWRLVRSIRRPLAAAVALAERTAAGDLREDAAIDRRSDELGRLLEQVVRMRARLREMLAGIGAASEAIRSATTEIAHGNQDLSSRTEQQASNLQQTAASIEQLTSTVKHNADAARQANQLAGAASSVAAKGGTVVAQVVQRMEQISDSSSRIAEIISVIDGIAFQTNILALNAAVEAARAGEQGRGFAVVAGEVRSLAQKSAQAAREIKTLIKDSVIKVESGCALVEQAGQTMEEIVAQVRQVTDLIGEITSATLEQSSGIGQINEAVTQLDRATQQNAALVEESAAAAASLRAQAERLAGSVALFKLSQVQAQVAVVRAEASSRSARRPPAPPPVRPSQAPAKPVPAGGDREEF
jgi:methyl-accepting chemotaxis protein